MVVPQCSKCTWQRARPPAYVVCERAKHGAVRCDAAQPVPLQLFFIASFHAFCCCAFAPRLMRVVSSHCSSSSSFSFIAHPVQGPCTTSDAACHHAGGAEVHVQHNHLTMNGCTSLPCTAVYSGGAGAVLFCCPVMSSNTSTRCQATSARVHAQCCRPEAHAPCTSTVTVTTDRLDHVEVQHRRPCWSGQR